MIMNDKNRIIQEQRKIIGIVPVMDMRHFVLLLLVDLARKGNDGNHNVKTAHLNANYKSIIEKIMYQENGWGMKFADLIDIPSYYECQLDWEEELSFTIMKVLKELNKEYYFDLVNDCIKIQFTEQEIDSIRSMYDTLTLEKMDHFSSLVDDRLFTRWFELNNKEEDKKIKESIIPVIDMKNFVLLLLADLARKEKNGNRNVKTAHLNTNYKAIIEKIMYEENGWGIKFADLIDISSYYECQLDWEEELSFTIIKVLKELNKEYYFDLENDCIKIQFTKQEIDSIRSMYDTLILEKMDHFSNLVNDLVFTRRFELNKKEYTRMKARYEYGIQELLIRGRVTNRVLLAKPLFNDNKEEDKKTKESFVKKMVKSFGKKQ